MTLAFANYLLSLLWLLSSAWAAVNPVSVRYIVRWFLGLPQDLQTIVMWLWTAVITLHAVLGVIFFVKETKQAMVLMMLIWSVAIPMFLAGMRNLKRHLATAKS